MPLIFYEDSDPDGRIKWILASILITFVEWGNKQAYCLFSLEEIPLGKQSGNSSPVNIPFLILLTTFSVLIIYLFNLLPVRFSNGKLLVQNERRASLRGTSDPLCHIGL